MTSFELKFDCEAFAVAFHPREDLISSGLISGAVHLHSYCAKNPREVWRSSHHSKACRALAFSTDGTCMLHVVCCLTHKGNLKPGSIGLWSASKDKSIKATDMISGQNLKHIIKAHRYDG
jgi:WD40 repeat protein